MLQNIKRKIRCKPQMYKDPRTNHPRCCSCDVLKTNVAIAIVIDSPWSTPALALGLALT